MKAQTETPERYFFKYAFPCAFVLLKSNQITKEKYSELEKKFYDSSSPKREELEEVYKGALIGLKILGKIMGKDYWSIDVFKEYFRNGFHNKIIDEDYANYKLQTHESTDLCKIHEANVIEKGKNSLLVKYGGKKRRVNNFLVPEAKKGNIVTIHFYHAIEKIGV